MRPNFLRPSLATRRLFVTEEPNTRLADTIMAVCAALVSIVLLSLNVYEFGRDAGRSEMAQSCPPGTAVAVRNTVTGTLKCVAYQKPMEKSAIEKARMRTFQARAV